TRASFMLGLQGLVLTIFAGVFTTYWVTTQPSTFARVDPVGWALGLVATLGVFFALILAVVLEILVLLPRLFAAGIDLPGSFIYAADPQHSTTRLREETMKAMVEV